MLVANKTHYFSEVTRTKNFVPDPTSFSFQSNKREGYYLRLHFEFEYCKSVGGQCFFVTFTYNNKSVPKYPGCIDKNTGKPVMHNVFNYEHIRLITNGVLSKTLYRKYGSDLKYFCACESDSSGDRGNGNNPHYHFIFFVLPTKYPNSKIASYTPIDPKEFFGICQEIWQGKRGFFPWKYAKFGSVKAGRFGIVVQDTRAFKYVGKYCIKSGHQLSIEHDIREMFFSKAMQSFGDKFSFERYYQSLSYQYTRDQFARQLGLSDWNMLLDFISKPDIDVIDWCSKSGSANPAFIPAFRKWYVFEVACSFVDAWFNQFKNKYSGKVRCSKSLGISGLSAFEKVDSDPYVIISEKSGPKKYKPSLYYVRHLYFDVVKCSVTGSPLYVLNSLGKRYKLASLQNRIGTFYHRTLDNLSMCLDNNIKFEFKPSIEYVTIRDISKFTFDTEVVSYDPLIDLRRLHLTSDFLKTIYKYAVYHCVYQFRFYSFSTPVQLSPDIKYLDVLSDYDYFLQQDMFKIEYDDDTIDLFIQRFNSYLSDPPLKDFRFNPVFRQYADIFDLLDCMNAAMDKIVSDKRKKDFDEFGESLQKINAYDFLCSV